MKINLHPAVGLTLLRKNAELKENVFKEIGILCQQLVTSLQPPFAYCLNRRLTQMKERDSRHMYRSNFEHATILCFNNVTLTWGVAFRQLTGDLNSFDSRLSDVGCLMEESSIAIVKDIMDYASINLECRFLKDILIAFPLMYVKTIAGAQFLINLHQTSSGCQDLDELLKAEDNINIPSTSSSTSRKRKSKVTEPSTTNRETSAAPRKSGPLSVEEKFPDIAVVATEFIKQNGYKAQEKWRDDSFVSCGVSVESVRQHLLENIPGLAEYGISKTTVRYFFQPVNKRRTSSKSYKSLIECRVPKKDNSLRVVNENSHYLHCRVKLRLEQAFNLEDEHMVISADATNKVHVGTLAVSRYHQIRRFYPENDLPQYKDHDFPFSYKIIPCGKMPLLKKGTHLHDIFTEVDFETTENPEEVYVNDLTDEDCDFDDDGCIKVQRPEPISLSELNVDNAVSDMLISEDEVMLVEKEPETGDSPNASDSESISSITSIEDLDIDSMVEHDVVEHNYKVDRLGRNHIDYPRTGPVLVYNRNGVFHQQTMESHANDFLPLFKASVRNGKTVIACIVDNGPDMDPVNYVNEIYWGKLWVDSGADMIQCISYAAGQSAYNPIEHAWSPLSNCLTSVVLPATLPGEDLPPCKQDLTEQEKDEKEAEMFDLAADKLSSYWKNITFDGHAVVPINIPSKETNKFYNDHDSIHRFVEAPLRDFNTVEYLKKNQKKFKFYAKHAIRRDNEFVLLKCQFFREPEDLCKYCRNNPPTATKTVELMKKNNGKLFEPVPSSTDDEHYHTFLEMIDMVPVEAGTIFDTSELGACEICPSWKFTSNSEVDCHKKILHPFTTMENVCTKRKFTCNFKMPSGSACSQVFKTAYKLTKHKDSTGHKRSHADMAREQDDARKKKNANIAKEAEVASSVAKK